MPRVPSGARWRTGYVGVLMLILIAIAPLRRLVIALRRGFAGYYERASDGQESVQSELAFQVRSSDEGEERMTHSGQVRYGSTLLLLLGLPTFPAHCPSAKERHRYGTSCAHDLKSGGSGDSLSPPLEFGLHFPVNAHHLIVPRSGGHQGAAHPALCSLGPHTSPLNESQDCGTVSRQPVTTRARRAAQGCAEGWNNGPHASGGAPVLNSCWTGVKRYVLGGVAGA